MKSPWLIDYTFKLVWTRLVAHTGKPGQRIREYTCKSTKIPARCARMRMGNEPRHMYSAFERMRSRARVGQPRHLRVKGVVEKRRNISSCIRCVVAAKGISDANINQLQLEQVRGEGGKPPQNDAPVGEYKALVDEVKG